MRNPNVHRLLFLIALAAACGPSSSEVSGAKTARYTGDKLAIFNAAKDAAAAKYKIEKSDENALGFQTLGRWYTPEGLAAAESGGDMRVVPDNSLSIAFVVALRPDGDAYVVDIKPLMIRFHAGSPKPEPISADDPSVPGWASGKLDALALDIHEALKPYEVGGSMSAPAGSAAPAAGSAAPAAGSAAPAAPAPATGSAAPALPAAPASSARDSFAPRSRPSLLRADSRSIDRAQS